MQQNQWIDQFNSEMRSIIEEYVNEQDFHAIETPLKSDKQFKNELKNALLEENNFAVISRGIINAVDLLDAQLMNVSDDNQREKISNEFEVA